MQIHYTVQRVVFVALLFLPGLVADIAPQSSLSGQPDSHSLQPHTKFGEDDDSIEDFSNDVKTVLQVVAAGEYELDPTIPGQWQEMSTL